MNRPEFLKSYRFNWEAFDIIIGGKSSLDAKNYLSNFGDKDHAHSFLRGYGFDVNDPVQAAEIFGNFQEALQFIKRYFLKEGNPEGLDISVPNIFYSITDVSELLMILNGKSELQTTYEESLWAAIILKVMHTILHTDKDLRYNYFSTIQTQIFDRFYKYVQRDDEGKLFLADDSGENRIPIVEFETKAKKTRESIIIKLLHKQENVAEELFDRIGIRIVTRNKVDTLRVIKFLQENYIIMANNIKPSRSQNSLFDMQAFKKGYHNILRELFKSPMSEQDFAKKLEQIADESSLEIKSVGANKHSSDNYKAIHFTCRQLIKYRNPFLTKFNEIKRLAKKTSEESELAQKILELDTSTLTRDVRFFYPFEVQITDIVSHQQNTEGEASHGEYKKSQLQSARTRLFTPLLEYRRLAMQK